jgi:hypothetical protein
MCIFDVYIMYYFDRCLIFAGTGDSTSDPYPYEYEVNPHPLVDMGDPMDFLS